MGSSLIGISVQREGSVCDADRFIALDHRDFLNDRIFHVIEQTVFIINIHIELQIQTGDILRKAGQGLGFCLLVTGQLVIGIG